MTQIEQAQERLRQIGGRREQIAELQHLREQLADERAALINAKTALLDTLFDGKPTLPDAVLKVEAFIISNRLNHYGGVITKAADDLGISYQSLAYILSTRQKALMPERTVVHRRAKRK